MLSSQKGQNIRSGSLNIDVIETYQDYINDSRQKFENFVSETKEFSIEMALKLTDDLGMRLEYYKQIKKYRKIIKQEAKFNQKTEENQLFDVTLKVKHPQETKQFHFSERQNNEVLMILGRIRQDLE